MALPALTIPAWIGRLPRGEDLPYDGGSNQESQRHVDQAEILVTSLWYLWRGRQDVYAGRNMFFYFDPRQARRNSFEGPDVFAAIGVERKERKSWVVWEEDGKVPDVIIELTSPSTIREDHNHKKLVYASIGVPEYFIYDPFTHELTGYRLRSGGGNYDPIKPSRDKRLRSLRLGLSLGLHPDDYRGFAGPWLRWFQGSELLPVAGEQLVQAKGQLERAEEQRQQAEEQRQQAEEQRQRAEAQTRELEERLKAYEARFGPLDKG